MNDFSQTQPVDVVLPETADAALDPAEAAVVADPSVVPDASAAGNSESIRSLLNLLGEACATARAMLIAEAAERWSTNPRSCHAQDGEVIHTPTWRKLRYGELIIDAAYRPVPKEVELKPSRAESYMV